MPITSPLMLSTLNGNNGFAVTGNTISSYFVYDTARGDINGDGIDDLLLGSYSASRCYVIFGSNQPFNPSLDLTNLNGANGFSVHGSGFLGAAVASGDINGDGIDDLITGAYQDGSGGSGYVLYGSRQPFSPVYYVADLNGDNGFKISGSGGLLGVEVSSGDINSDGIDDVIISAPYYNSYAGIAYVIFGSSQPFSATFSLSSLNGSNGFAINGLGSNGFLGSSLSSGDINGDGIADILLGASAQSSTTRVGQVVFGSRQPFSSPFNIANLNGSNGFAIQGPSISQSAYTIRSGDINGDGIDDLLIPNAWLPAPGASGSNTPVHVIYGSRQPFSSPFNLNSLNGVNGFIITGYMTSSFGTVVSGDGDINGDQIHDLVIETWRTTSSSTSIRDGYVLYGSRQPFNANVNVSSLDGQNGFVISGFNPSYDSSTVSQGDLNNDGFSDIFIGLGGSGSGLSNAGYVIFGQLSQITTAAQTTAQQTTAQPITGIQATTQQTTPEQTTHQSITTAQTLSTDNIATTAKQTVISSASQLTPWLSFNVKALTNRFYSLLNAWTPQANIASSQEISDDGENSLKKPENNVYPSFLAQDKVKNPVEQENTATNCYAYENSSVILCHGDDYHIQIFPQVSASTIVGHADAMPEPTAMREDHYTVQHCRPIEFNGQSSVYCEGDHSTFVYTPQLPARPFENMTGTILLARFAWHAATVTYQWLTQPSSKTEEVKSMDHAAVEREVVCGLLDECKDLLDSFELKLKESPAKNVKWALFDIEDYRQELQKQERRLNQDDVLFNMQELSELKEEITYFIEDNDYLLDTNDVALNPTVNQTGSGFFSTHKEPQLVPQGRQPQSAVSYQQPISGQLIK